MSVILYYRYRKYPSDFRHTNMYLWYRQNVFKDRQRPDTILNRVRGYKQPFNRFDKIVRIKKKKKTAIFQIVFWFSRTEGAKLESRGPEVRPPSH